MSANLMSLACSGGKFLKLFGDRKMMKPLPYDAEVEYLESTGTQAIQTGYILFDNLNRIRCEFMTLNIPDTGTDAAPFATSINKIRCTYPTDYSASASTMNVWGTGGKWLTIRGFDRSAWHAWDSLTDDSSRHWELKFDGLNLYNGTYPSGSTVKANAGICLFGYGTSATTFFAAGKYRIKSFSAYYGAGETPRLDMIPVRKDGVGYMYDRVSGELFGNDGTGAFIIGPDKTI